MLEMNLTERELELIRSALCAKSLKTLCHAQEIEKECKENGFEDSSYIQYDVRDEIKSIIARIDEIKGAN
jgi:hypothetical protein